MYSILHITDLHRSVSDSISNAELLSSLVSDRDNYVNEEVPIIPPQAVIVSGDIIKGVGLGVENFKDELTSQYQVAHEFLANLADEFLNGDRSRVIGGAWQPRYRLEHSFLGDGRSSPGSLSFGPLERPP